MSTPRVSVVVPCFDLGEFLDEAVDSVLRQTFTDLEVLVVDDGSSDPATVALLDRYDRPRTRVLRAAHAGASAARNRGIREARGEYLSAFDADDVLEPAFLEKTVAALDADPSLTFASCWLRAFGDEAWEWKPERCDLATLLGECTVLGPALVRRRAVVDAGGYDEALGERGDEDWDLWLTLLERGHRGTILPEILLRYRRRHGSLGARAVRPENHLGLVEYLVRKHAASYERHWDEVLLRKEAEIASLLGECDELERQLQSWLEPELARRSAELAELDGKLATARSARHAEERRRRLELRAEGLEWQVGEERRRGVALSEALANAERDLREIRTSKSWRVTAPLRAAHALLHRLRGGR